MTQPLPQTPNDIILLSLKMANVLGVGQSASGEDISDCFNILNMMLAQWQRRRWNVYQLVTETIQATGAQSYTVGTGQNFNIARPAKIESAYLTLQGQSTLPVDYPLEIIRAREDYNRISIKTLNAFPQFVFYDEAYPIGNLFVWPIPNNSYQITITVMQQLQNFATVNDQISLPPEYLAALMWNLALKIYPLYGLPVDATVQREAIASLNIIKEANLQLPMLHMPKALRNQKGTYNIYGDYYVGSTG